MVWQRRIRQAEEFEDFSEYEPDTEIIWIVRDAVICPNCGRVGAGFENGVVHSANVERDIYGDFCLNDLPPGSPELVVVSSNGDEVEAIPLTEIKTNNN